SEELESPPHARPRWLGCGSRPPAGADARQSRRWHAGTPGKPSVGRHGQSSSGPATPGNAGSTGVPLLGTAGRGATETSRGADGLDVDPPWRPLGLGSNPAAPHGIRRAPRPVAIPLRATVEPTAPRPGGRSSPGRQLEQESGWAPQPCSGYPSPSAGDTTRSPLGPLRNT